MNYKEILQNILANGKPKQPTRLDTNGKPISVENGTIGVFGSIFEHDMSQGFPLTTLRKMPFKSTAAELEFFIKGLTNKKFLQDRKSKFWDYWCNPKEIEQYPESNLSLKDKQIIINDLGPLGYSYTWRKYGKLYINNDPQIYSPYIDNIKNVDLMINRKSNSKHIGKIYDSNSCGPFIVLSVKSTSGKNKRSYYDIMFMRTGFIVKDVSSSNISNGNIKDLYYPKVSNVGCIGEGGSKHDKMYSIWRNMIQRCYYNKAINYKFYGEKGVRVCNRWLNYSVFAEDVKKIPNYDLKIKNFSKYSLDKDLLGNGLLYSPDTCCWLSENDQKRNTSRNVIFEATSSDNVKSINNCIIDFSILNNLDPSSVSKAIRNNTKVKGWSFKSLGNKQKSYNDGIDQLKNLVDKLKACPYDRRMVVTSWNPLELNNVALPACHTQFTVCVYGDKLNLAWDQRSCDWLINQTICTYGLLLLLLCEESGLKPGVLQGRFVDNHIYENQMDAAKLIVSRDEKELPQVKIKRKPDGSFSIFDWTYDEVELIGYDPHPSVNMGEITV